MKTAILAGLVLAVASAIPLAGGDSDGISYGGGVTVDVSTPLQELLSHPQDHVDQTVRIDGIVTEVCRSHGDWLKVSLPRGGSGVLVVLGDEFAVPTDCLARRVAVQGVWTAVPVTSEGLDSEEAAAASEPHVCTAMTRGEIRYHLRGTGVVVHR